MGFNRWRAFGMIAVPALLFLALPMVSGAIVKAAKEPLVGEWPDTTFAVLSDMHVYDPALGVGGQALDDYIKSDRKMIRESYEIAATALARVAKGPAEFVLICGDLTKDGELDSHRKVSALLGDLESKGKKVYVIPGNHDIDNPNAMKYVGGKAEVVPGLDSTGFSGIYGEFGYSEAIYRDKLSLSYVAEPVKGLWLLALDGVTYPQELLKGGISRTVDPAERELEESVLPGGGLLRPETKTWMAKVLIEAKSQGKRVIAMTHHGVVEHFKGQGLAFGRWLYTDRYDLQHVLAKGGVPVVFTGHFHSQDITVSEGYGRRLFDVQTGSLVTGPCPYRLVNMSHMGVMDITTSYVEAIPSMGQGFKAYSEASLEMSLDSLTDDYLTKFGIRDSSTIKPYISGAFKANFQGDEGRLGSNRQTPPDMKGQSIRTKLLWSLLKGFLIDGMYKDTNTADNNATISIPR